MTRKLSRKYDDADAYLCFYFGKKSLELGHHVRVLGHVSCKYGVNKQPTEHLWFGMV